MTKLYDIPSMGNFLKGLDTIRLQQLEAREMSKFDKYPFESEDKQYSKYSTGIVTPKGKHYQIDSDGELSFTGTKQLFHENKESYPPFSAAELLLESKDDFKIDFYKAVEYYNHNKELAIKENQSILSSKEFIPEHPLKLTIAQETKEVQRMLEDNGKDPAVHSEISDLLDKHFSKIEKLLYEYSDKIENGPVENIPELEKSLKEKVTNIFTNFKDDLKQLFMDMKNRVQTGIDNKINDVKVNIHNAIATKVQAVNDKIKNFTNTLDGKYQIIEKANKELENDNVESRQEKEIKLDIKDNEETVKDEVRSILAPKIEKYIHNYDKSTYSEDISIKDSELTLVMKGASGDNHKFNVDLNTGNTNLVYHFQNSRNEDWFADKRVLENFNINDLRNQTQEHTEKLETKIAQNPSSNEIKLNNNEQDSPAYKKAPDSLESVKTEDKQVRGDTLNLNSLMKQNNGLKTFVNIVKAQHPKVYESIFNELKGYKQDQPLVENETIKVKGKEKEIQLEI